MATIHIEASIEDIANLVLLSGDPLRAKYIAEQFLTNVKQINKVRNMLGYTGYYKGQKVTVMGSGMGCGSMGIYAHELFYKYHVDRIIRVGSCGGYDERLKLEDLLIVDSCWSNTNFAKIYSGSTTQTVQSNQQLFQKMLKSAETKQYEYKVGRIHTSDCFYHLEKENLKEIVEKHECLAVDMESFALLHIGEKANKQAASILTVSDHLLSSRKLTREEREIGFHKMIQVALDAIIDL